MKTRTNKSENSAAGSDGDAVAETESKPGAVFTEAPSSEVWIFDGIDKNSVPYEIDLPHPRTGSLTTFAVGPRNGSAVVGEIRVFKSSTPASFLTVLGEEEGSENKNRQDGKRERKALISRPDLRIVTEIDPVFLLLPILAPSKESTSRDESGRGMFLAFDDLMDTWKAKSEHVSRIVDPGYVFESDPKVSLSLVSELTAALERCCDTVMAGDETMYRFSEDKFFRIVVEKAQRMVAAGLPPSLEEVALSTVETTGLSAEKPIELDTESTGTPGPGESDESQTSNVSSVFSRDESNPAGSKAVAPVSPILSLMRLRVALGFILSNYVPPSVSKKIIARLDRGDATGIDFTPLRTQIEKVKAQRSAIMMARNATSSSKRAYEEDEGAMEREEKRRKKEEEEKKRKSESVGIKALRKVDTSGMKKLSSFFAVKPKAS